MGKRIKKPSSTPALTSSPSAAETHFPSPIVKRDPPLTEEEKIDLIADRFKEILEILGLDLTDESIAYTPYRIARMYVQEFFSGLDERNFPEVRFFKSNYHLEGHKDIVLIKVSFTSFCEHHFVPIIGFAYIAYIPNDQLIGLSKIPRIVRFFARRPQVQERLTAQIADCLAILLQTENVAVSLNARHHCVIARGIQDENSHMITNVLRGEFQENEKLRKEFFEGINRQDLS
jgi:GTP cyclohydrolase IA